MKKRALIILALALVMLGFIASRPPRAWGDVVVGMSRQEVYKRLGKPASSSETGFDFWRKDLLIGRWQFSVAYHSDDKVSAFGYRWIWNI